MDAPDIRRIYDELEERYSGIDGSAMQDVLTGKTKVKSSETTFRPDAYTTPKKAEAEDAFKKFNCVIFTAFRGGYTLEENLTRNRRLKEDMQEMGMRFRPVNGCYKEADWEYPSVEYCYFVYDSQQKENFSFFEKAYKLSAKYDQDSFLYKRAGINRTAFLVATTQAGRKDLRGDFKFAGQLFMDVPDVAAWTDCSDGRFAFQLKGMVLIPTANKKINMGEGDIFDVEGYNADGILVLRRESQTDLADACKAYQGEAPLVQHVFSRDDYSGQYIHEVIFRCLKSLRDRKCKRIGIHCSVPHRGSTLEGARLAYEAITLWAERYKKKVETIVIVDTYGEYNKLQNAK